MQTLKIFFQTVVQFVRSLPQSFHYASQVRKQRLVRNELEVERVDRLRNPSKYRVKEL